MELFNLFGRIVVDNNRANAEIDETTNKAGNAESKMVSSFKKIGAAVATYFAVDKIVSFGKEVVNTAAEVAAEASAFEQIMGDYSDEAAAKVGKIADATGMVDTRLTPYMTSMTAKFKGLGYDVNDATDFAARGLTLAADASAFWDKSLDESMSHLNSFINGSYEGGEAIGLFANDTQMAAYAVKTGLISETKEWSSLEESIKQATRLEYAENMMKTSGAVGQAAKESRQYANVQANLTEKWRQFKAQIGEPLLEKIVLPVMDKLIGVVDVLSDKFEKVCKWCSEHKKTLENLAIVVGVATGALIAFKIAMAISNTINAVKKTLDGMTIAQWALNAAMNANPITWIVIAIAALVAAILLLWNNCDGFKNAVTAMWKEIKAVWSQCKPFFEAIWKGIKAIFSVVKDFFVSMFKGAWEGVKLAWSIAVDFFKTIWKNIKLTFSAVKSTLTSNFSDAWNSVKQVFSNVKSFFSGVIEKISTTFSKVTNIVTSPFKSARKTLGEIVEKIKKIFDFDWSLPKPKMPKFSVSGGEAPWGFMGKGKMPKVSIDWYKKAYDEAMVLDSPTIFGYSAASGKLLGGGDGDGNEIVAGESHLLEMIGETVENKTQSNRIIELLVMLLDAIVGGNKELLKAILAGQKIVLNEREVGRTVRTYA